MLQKTLRLSLGFLLLAIMLSGCAQGAKTGAKLGYITNIKVEDMRFDFDEVEWISFEDTERMKELGLLANDMPSGFHIHNPDTSNNTYNVSEKATFVILDWKNGFESEEVSFDEFAKYHDEFCKAFDEPFGHAERFIPCWIETENDAVISVKQQYLP